MPGISRASLSKGTDCMKLLDKETTQGLINMCKWDGHFIRPIDSLTFDEGGAAKAKNFWKDRVNVDELPPDGELNADILLSGTVPVYDMLLETTTEKKRGEILYARVMIRPDLIEMVDQISGEIYAGILLAYTEVIKYLIPFKVSVNSDHIIFPDEYGIVASTPEELDFYINNPDVVALYDISNWKSYLELWYGITWVILHPIARHIIRKETESTSSSVDASDTDIKPPISPDGLTVIKYVRTIVITEEDFERVESAIRKIKKDCWPVTGHWRNQPTKKGYVRKFIKPYWKGPLRDLKMHDTRIRELIYEESDPHAGA